MQFLLFSQENFQNFLKYFTIYCVFRPDVRKNNAGYVNLFRKNSLKLCIYCNFLKKFFKFFENSPASGGLRPPQADPLRCQPEPKSLRRRCNRSPFFRVWIASWHQLVFCRAEVTRGLEGLPGPPAPQRHESPFQQHTPVLMLCTTFKKSSFPCRFKQ